MTGCRVSYSVDELRGGMDCDGDADASNEYLARMWREHKERAMGKSKREQATESRDRANWLELEAAIDDLKTAVKKRDKDSASMAFEVTEEAMSKLVIGEARATDAD